MRNTRKFMGVTVACGLLFAAHLAAETRYAIVEVHEAADKKGKGKKDLQYTIGFVVPSSYRISWADGVTYDLGNDPQVTWDENLAIELHRKLHAKSDEDERRQAMKCRVGLLGTDGVHIDWGKSHDLPAFRASKITLIDGVAILAHEFRGELRYILGNVDREKRKIAWGEEFSAGIGFRPVIDASAGSILEIHEAEGELKYRLGRLSSDQLTISWSQSQTYLEDLNVDELALSYSGDKAAAVYASGDDLLISVGAVARGTGQVSWSDPMKYAEGSRPDVHIQGDGVVVAYRIIGSRKEARTPKTMVGTVDPENMTIKWGRAIDGPRRATYYSLD